MCSKGGQLGVVKRETTSSGSNIMHSGGNIMHSEDVVLSHVEPMQMELKYGGAFGPLLTNKTTPTRFIHNKCPARVTLEDVTKVT
jgi:hypothetical protein